MQCNEKNDLHTVLAKFANVRPHRINAIASNVIEDINVSWTQ